MVGPEEGSWEIPGQEISFEEDVPKDMWGQNFQQNCKTMVGAVDMNYTYRNVIKIHGKALQKFEIQFKEFLEIPYLDVI